MLPDERDMMDAMAGGSIMDRNPIEVWHLIEDRAAVTRPYTEYSKLSREEIACQHAAAEHMFHQKQREAAEACQRVERVYQHAENVKKLAELNKEIAELDEKLEEIAKNRREVQSAPEPVQSSLDDEEVMLPMIERAEEDIMDEELQVVPIASVEDVPTVEWISQQCLDIFIDHNTIIACNPIIPPTSNRFLSSNVQNGAIQKALRNNQVWGCLGKVILHIPMVRTPTLMLNSEKFLDGLCINWKTRKKDMRGSLEKMDIHMVRAPKQTQKNL